MKLKIGLDFDNTLVDYRELFFRLATEQGRSWLTTDHPKNKVLIRQTLIAADGNDLRWQRLQAEAYGHRILEAKVFEGARGFVNLAHAEGHELFIISHKTEHSNFDSSVSLRTAARTWLAQADLNIPGQNIRFEATQDAKLEALAQIGCDVFIDDLLELLIRPDFPNTTLPICFAPETVAAGAPLAFSSWSGISAFIRYCANQKNPPVRAQMLERQGNSRLYRLTERDGACRILKKYPAPSRDFAACELLWSHGFRDLPEPIWQDDEGRIAVYARSPGQTPEDATPELIDQSIDFVSRLRKLSSQSDLPPIEVATDGRTRLRDYTDILEHRRARIETDPRGRRFFDSRVKPLWTAALGKFHEGVRVSGADLDTPFDKKELLLSPSDFGLHNMLIVPGQKPVFLDFEYFGWDDPAKLVADYFHSVAQKVPWCLKWRFFDGVAALLHSPQEFRRRWDLVVDLIGLEWVLIVLNVFDAEKMARKKFANPGILEDELLRERTAKAEKLLADFAANRGSYLTIPDRMS